VTPNGFIDTIAGGSDRGDSGDGGPAKAALLFGASSLAVDLRETCTLVVETAFAG